MKHLTLTFLFMLFFVSALLSQTGIINGLIIDSKTAAPIEGVSVSVKGTPEQTTTNSDGKFTLTNIPSGEGVFIFSATNYLTKELAFLLDSSSILDIGSVALEPGISVEAATEAVPVIILEESDLEDENSQNVSGLLYSSDDVFSSAAAYNFGSARFRTRGYDSENSSVFMNGILMNDLENGRPDWSDWGGLNDALRTTEVFFGSNNNDFSLTSLGGGSNIITRASNYSPGVKVSYMSTNSNYRNRVMATASTGLMENNWAVTVSGSRRWAYEGYVEGTSYDAWAYFLSAEKVFNKKHSLALTAFAAPNKRGKQIGSTQEAYDYLDDNYYNANWGYQDGEKRNARVANSHKPFFSLNHYWNLYDDLKINTSVAYSFGRDGNTALNWYDAADPRPNYYKYLPYYNVDVEDYTWDNQQLDWDFFYFANSKNLYTVEDVDGISGNDVTANRSKYIVENQRIDHSKITANSQFLYNLSEKLKLTGNLNYSWYKGRHFKLIDDLLGGDWWVDVDQFAERDFSDNDLAQSDLNNPNRIVKEGDVFGYDYDANIQKIGGFAKADYSINEFELYLGIDLSNTSFYRTGNMKNGKFPDNSYGDSEKQSFFNYGVKGGITYKLTGRHIFYANASYITRAPFFDDAYISPRTRDYVVDGLTSEKMTSFDINYVLRLPYLTGRISGYYSLLKDQADVMSFYHDEERTFVNYAITGIDKKHFGTEIGLESKISPSFSVTAVAAIGQYTWDSRPNVTITQDNNSEILAENEPVYVKNFYVDGTPQTAYSLSLNYNSPKFWWVELSGNYFDNMYLSFNPARRTADAIIGLDPESAYGAAKIDEITHQEKLPGQYIFDLSIGKSFKFGDYYININANINNLLDNQEFITGGYEQLRYDYENMDINKFQPVYFYMYGRSYMLMLSVRF